VNKAEAARAKRLNRVVRVKPLVKERLFGALRVAVINIERSLVIVDFLYGRNEGSVLILKFIPYCAPIAVVIAPRIHSETV